MQLEVERPQPKQRQATQKREERENSGDGRLTADKKDTEWQLNLSKTNHFRSSDLKEINNKMTSQGPRHTDYI